MLEIDRLVRRPLFVDVLKHDIAIFLQILIQDTY